MKPEFIYDFKEKDKVMLTVERMAHVNDDLDVVEYSGTLTGEIAGIEDNIEYCGMSGIYLDYNEDISSGPKMVYVHHSEIVSITKM